MEKSNKNPMKRFCARDKKKYRPTAVGADHCKGCTISMCMVKFNH